MLPTALLERSLAAAAGLGTIGRHTQLIVPRGGSQVVIGELLMDHALPPDAPTATNPCEGCTACLEACPTGALRPDGYLDARQCLSYWTTSATSAIPAEMR